jgi:hypothetical protein
MSLCKYSQIYLGTVIVERYVELVLWNMASLGYIFRNLHVIEWWLGFLELNVFRGYATFRDCFNCKQCRPYSLFFLFGVLGVGGHVFVLFLRTCVLGCCFTSNVSSIFDSRQWCVYLFEISALQGTNAFFHWMLYFHRKFSKTV